MLQENPHTLSQIKNLCSDLNIADGSYVSVYIYTTAGIITFTGYPRKGALKWLNYTGTYSSHVFTFLIMWFSTPLFPHQKRLKADGEPSPIEYTLLQTRSITQLKSRSRNHVYYDMQLLPTLVPVFVVSKMAEARIQPLIACAFILSHSCKTFPAHMRRWSLWSVFELRELGTLQQNFQLLFQAVSQVVQAGGYKRIQSIVSAIPSVILVTD